MIKFKIFNIYISKYQNKTPKKEKPFKKSHLLTLVGVKVCQISNINDNENQNDNDRHKYELYNTIAAVRSLHLLSRSSHNHHQDSPNHKIPFDIKL